MRAAALNGANLDVERVRFRDDPVAAQIVAFGFESETVCLVTETRQFNAQLHVSRWNRLVIPERIDAKFRVNTVFENGDLNGEITVAKHSTPMGAPFILTSRCCRAFTFGLGLWLAAGGKQSKRGNGHGPHEFLSGHQRFSALTSKGR